MAHRSERPLPPEGLPDRLVSDLDGSDAEDLRRTIIYAQELLQYYHEPRAPVDPAPDENILRVTERQGYTEVVKEIDCPEGCADCPHGPYLYHVSEEPHPDGKTGIHWTLIGDYYPEEGEFERQ